jgi:broad specificity phosphatase PhoE
VDVRLTPLGIGHAATLADKLRHTQIDHIYVSEFKRTQQTAEIVNQFHRLKIEADSRLDDGRSGFEGRHFEEYDKALEGASDR